MVNKTGAIVELFYAEKQIWLIFACKLNLGSKRAHGIHTKFHYNTHLRRNVDTETTIQQSFKT